jgi:quaternary ammonium compound-resistance protein SugE
MQFWWGRPYPNYVISMAWIYLVVAGFFEIGWAIGLKYTQGFTRFWPSVLTAAAIVTSMTLLALAVRTIPVGTGYAIWTGIGAVGTAVLGIALFSEPATAGRLFFLMLIIAGIVGLKFCTP